jgi:cell shape-determining protein MreD
MNNVVRHIVRFVLFILFQVFVLSKIPPLHQFIVPYLYFLYILWLPFSMSRPGLLLVAAIFGLVLDLFVRTPGLHMAACLLVAFLRPFMISLLMPKEATEISYQEPSIKSMSIIPYTLYVVVLTIFHHVYMVLLEWLHFGTFWYFSGKVLATTAVSLLLILIAEMLFPRKSRYRTNIA